MEPRLLSVLSSGICLPSLSYAIRGLCAPCAAGLWPFSGTNGWVRLIQEPSARSPSCRPNLCRHPRFHQWSRWEHVHLCQVDLTLASSLSLPPSPLWQEIRGAFFINWPLPQPHHRSNGIPIQVPFTKGLLCARNSHTSLLILTRTLSTFYLKTNKKSKHKDVKWAVYTYMINTWQNWD